MRLAKVADGTIKEDSSASLQKHITELEMSKKVCSVLWNSGLKIMI
jgi:hypothetical protein